MPYINVRITDDGVSREQKRQVIAEITDTMVRVLGKRPESVMVFIDEVSTDNIGIKGVTVSDQRAKAG
ncbi:4-oxalocrotonate tautomerase family protein [Nitratireductor mangrovi]|uniref:Tautomerase n=1 Tax=Nitratireductor mangrovi TaxID=2599600 RepID=A0A5B8KUR6_9HYPH|nr:4-oxalocrotonate tautomerase family protein [Nitratireductor mangrovi]QDY99287.1 4-oxalocrotonate tautomerase family protein [Nitratireductor mangrovi]